MANFFTGLKKATNHVAAKVFGTAHERTMKRLRPLLAQINDLEPEIRCLSDAELRGKTAEFRQQLDNGATLDDIMVEAFATIREASVRTTGMRHYDVQLVGGISLHQGMIAEMKTGEGKTLVAALALYLNALEGKGAHLVTVNDYLAARDAEWMNQIYGFMGLSTGTIEHGQDRASKRLAYGCDITYGQNNEFGFDYLRDNMRFSIYDYVQRDLNYAIVDEADSILVDEARTPLIISGAAEESASLYTTINQIIPKLRRDVQFSVDEERKTVTLTEEGVDEVEKLLSIRNLYDPANIEHLHHVHQALKAHYCYKKDVSYSVKDGESVIIDEFTGRMMPGRRWSDGLHQAIEAKEHVNIQEENRTLATISFQNLFRLYDKISGMTGTADTEAQEFKKTYKLDVVVIPTNRPCIREDFNDAIYRSYREKRTAVIEELLDCQERGQPVLVGTVSVEKSEDLARVLARKKIKHHVLNAKQHEREAYVVAQAGRTGAVTVATNMAGRGTDILLGGNPEMLAKGELEGQEFEDTEEYEAAYEETLKRYIELCAEERVQVLHAGGLHILGTERHESRRIDNQLRGRAGRQGDPGSSRFYLSLEDDLMRIFAGERVGMIMDKLGMPEGEPIEHGMVTKSVERAQTKVEARNFDIRKNLLEYDDVMNQQRKTIYALRRQILGGRYQSVSVSESEEVQRRAQKAAQTIDVDPVLRDRAAATLRQWFLKLGRMPRAEKEGDVIEDRPPRVESLVAIDAEELEKLVYDQIGVRVSLAGYEERPKEAYDLLLEECAQSLSEQRERLFDMIDELVGGLIEEHVTPDKLAERNLDSLYEALRKNFDIWLEGLDSLPGVEEMAKAVFDEVEWVIRIRDAELGAAQVTEIIDEAVYESCPIDHPADRWNLSKLTTQLEKKLNVTDLGDLEEELDRLSQGDNEDASSAPQQEQPDVRLLRRGIRDALLTKYGEHQRQRLRFLAPRDEASKARHPAEAIVQEQVKKYCDGEVSSTEWRLEELGREIHEATNVAPIRFELDVLKDDARKAISRNIALAAREREAEVLEKIVNQTCPGKHTDRWNREALADELMSHRGVHSSSVETAETHHELLDGIWGDLREHHHSQVIIPLEERVVELCPDEVNFEDWDLSDLLDELAEQKIKVPDIDRVELQRFVELRLFRSLERSIRARAHVLSPEAHLHAYRQLLLSEIDRQWIDHLQNMESLRQGIGMRSYGQRDPKREYQREGYQMFQDLIGSVQSNSVEKLFHIVFKSEDEVSRLGKRKKRQTTEGRGDDQNVKKGTVRRDRPKVGRNDLCPCGSGKKYKKCCMLKDQASA